MKKGQGIMLGTLCVLLVVLGVGAMFLLDEDSSQPSPPLEQVEPEPEYQEQVESEAELEEVAEEIEEVPEPVEFTILAVGDNLIHSGIYLQAQKRANYQGYDFTLTYEAVADYIQSADIASINQETPLAESFAPTNYPMFNSPVELGVHLADIGFDVVNLANNHMFDKGAVGLTETLTLFQALPETITTGAYLSADHSQEIPIVEVAGVQVAFLGATQSTNGLTISSSSPLEPCIINTEEEIVDFLAEVTRAKEEADLVVANLHWGVEYTHTPNEYQRSVAQRVIEAGVDVIFGHHPHVIQPVEYVTRTDGSQGIVAYSLGNFISGQDSPARMIGGMLELRFEAVGQEVTLIDVCFLPVITQYESYFANMRVYPYDSYTTELAKAHGVGNFSHSYIYQVVTQVIDDSFLPDDFHTLYPYA